MVVAAASEANRVIEREGRTAAEIDDTAHKQTVMIDEVLIRDWPVTGNPGLELWIEDEIHPLVEVLKSLEELNGKARVDKVADGAVDARSVRTNIDNLLCNPVGNASLVMETRQDVVQESAHGGADEEDSIVATGRRLRERLVPVTRNDGFYERGNGKAGRLHEAVPDAEVKILKLTVVRAVVEVGRLQVMTECMRVRPLVSPENVRQRCVHRNLVRQPVLHVPESTRVYRWSPGFPSRRCHPVGLRCARIEKTC